VTVTVYKTNSDDWNGGAAAGNGDETTLTYNNAPASAGALATFTGNGFTGWWAFHSDALTTYVRQQLTDQSGDGVVTFRLEATGSGLSQLCSFEDRENGGGTGNEPELGYYPTAVTVSSFTARPDQQGILLEWETASEVGSIGFNLYRATTPDGFEGGTAVQLNDQLIKGTGDPIQGGQYSFLDEEVAPGVRYYYWLEEVEAGGDTNPFGPVHTLWPGHRLYLPLVARR
jgi:hypothetical protein